MHANDRRSAAVPPLLVLMFLQNRPLTGVAKLYCVIMMIFNWIIIKNVSAFYRALLYNLGAIYRTVRMIITTCRL